MKKTVAFRLSIRFMIIVAAIVLLIANLFVMVLRFSIRQKQNRELFQTIQLLQNEMQKEEPFPEALSIPYYISYKIYNPETLVAYFTNDPLLPALQNTSGKTVHYYSKDFFSDGDLNILYCSVLFSPQTVIQTAMDIEQDSSIAMVNSLPKVAVIALIPILLISFLLSLLISKQTLKPVQKITEAAQGISSTNLEKLLPVSKNDDELDNLAKTFNQLFESLKKDFDREASFTSDVSHELKTPVAGILGQAGMLKRWGKNDPEQLDESLDLIINEATSMESIITTLLQASKIEHGIIKPSLIQVNLWSLFYRLKNEFAVISPEAKILFDDNLDVVLITDMELLHQVLTAFISNSIKFGGTEIELKAFIQNTSLSQKSDSSTKSKTIIQVIDNGPGFNEEVLPHIFERFYRGDASHNRSSGGAGLGLSISTTIINALGGKILAANCLEHKGAVLSVEL